MKKLPIDSTRGTGGDQKCGTLWDLATNDKSQQGWGDGSVGRMLPITPKALGFTPSIVVHAWKMGGLEVQGHLQLQMQLGTGSHLKKKTTE